MGRLMGASMGWVALFVWVSVWTCAVMGSCSTPAGQISALNDFYNSTNGNHWLNTFGWGTNTDPCGNGVGLLFWYGIRCDTNCNVLALELGLNALRGPIPETIDGLNKLEEIDFSNNYLNGPIPPSLGNTKSLEGLYLYANGLSGTIPPELGNLTNLRTFELQINNLVGTIPTSLGHLVKLSEFDLSDNKLNGTIPAQLSSLQILVFFSVSLNELVSPIPDFLQDEPRYTADLSENLFTCPLPSWCGPPPKGGGECMPCYLS